MEGPSLSLRDLYDDVSDRMVPERPPNDTTRLVYVNILTLYNDGVVKC